MHDDDKRSSNDKLPLTPNIDKSIHTNILIDSPRVGGRQKAFTHFNEVGGYLDICNISDSAFIEKIRKFDPRLQDLRDMGIGNKWFRIAEVIGYEDFMAVWMILGEDDFPRIRMPSFSKFRRYQRNKLIKKMDSEGLRTDQIKKNIKKILCEDVSLRHIDRICEKGKVK